MTPCDDIRKPKRPGRKRKNPVIPGASKQAAFLAVQRAKAKPSVCPRCLKRRRAFKTLADGTRKRLGKCRPCLDFLAGWARGYTKAD